VQRSLVALESRDWRKSEWRSQVADVTLATRDDELLCAVCASPSVTERAKNTRLADRGAVDSRVKNWGVSSDVGNVATRTGPLCRGPYALEAVSSQTHASQIAGARCVAFWLETTLAQTQIMAA